MKFRLALLLISVFFIAGCSDLSKQSSYTTTYSVSTINNTSATGYVINKTLPSPALTLLTYPKETPTSSTLLPLITFNQMDVTYTVVQDSAGNLIGTWAPSTESTGVNIVIPAGTNSSSITITDNNIASSVLASEVFNKIGSIAVSSTASGTYAFALSLNTSLAIRANTTLTGTDERGQPVSLTFSTTLYFAISS